MRKFLWFKCSLRNLKQSPLTRPGAAAGPAVHQAEYQRKPLSALPAVVAAVSEAEVEKLRLYTDPACAELLRTAAAHFGLQPDQVMPGNGSDENLFFALRAF